MPQREDSGRGDHTVPAFHLGLFGTGRGRKAKLWVYDKVKGEFRPTSVGKAGVIGDYYTADEIDEPRAIDGALTGIEGRAAPIVKALARGVFPQTPEERMMAALYFTSLNRRVPATRNALKGVIEDARNKLTIAMFENPEAFRQRWIETYGQTPDAEVEAARMKWLKLWSEGEMGWRAPDTLTLAAIQATLRLAPQVAAMPWTLLRWPKHPRFLLGDNPGFAMRSSPTDEDHLQRWVIPLGPDTVLICNNRAGADEVLVTNASDPTLDAPARSLLARADPRIRDNVGAQLGVLMWRASERWVYGRDRRDLEYIAGLIEEEDRDQPGSALVMPSKSLIEALGRLVSRARSGERAV